MKSFRFALESLRVLRQQKERVAQQQYVRALNVCNQAVLRLEQAVAELQVGWKLLGHELDKGITAGRLAGLRDWCQALETRRNERRITLEEARQAARLAHQEMTAATCNREALDRFRNKLRRMHEREVQREEQKYFDEIAVQRSESPGPFQFTGHETSNRL